MGGSMEPDFTVFSIGLLLEIDGRRLAGFEERPSTLYRSLVPAAESGHTCSKAEEARPAGAEGSFSSGATSVWSVMEPSGCQSGVKLSIFPPAKSRWWATVGKVRASKGFFARG